MIGVFADPYPDELFYSICARICKRAGYSTYCSAMRDLFGCETVITSVALPVHLDNFVVRLPPESVYTSDYLIAEHTLLPFYQPFLQPERSRRLRQGMCGQEGPALHLLSGIATSPIPQPEWFRFCPQCVGEDKSRYGECYWHRVHQIPGVEICPLHEVYLQESNARARNRKHEVVSAEDAVGWTEQQLPHTQSPYHQVLLALARDVTFLLRQHHLSEGPALLSHRYRKLLFERGLVAYGGRVERRLFLQQFRDCYPPQLLQLLHCEFDRQLGRTWLHRLVLAPDSAQHPLHHLLLIHFLGYAAEDFFRLSVKNQPFGDGPFSLHLKGPKIAGLSREQVRDPTTLETKRTTWLTLMQAHPGAGVSLLRSKETGLYSWLYRNDKPWLQAHVSLCKKPNSPARFVDWEARDLQLAEEVRRAALLLKDLPGHPIHITISSLGRAIGQFTFLHRQNLNKLPRTAEVLSKSVETREAFAVRRVWWAMTAFSQEHIYPLRWQLIERAGVRRLVTRPEVKSALDTVLQILRREWKV